MTAAQQSRSWSINRREYARLPSSGPQSEHPGDHCATAGGAPSGSTRAQKQADIVRGPVGKDVAQVDESVVENLGTGCRVDGVRLSTRSPGYEDEPSRSRRSSPCLSLL